MITSPWAHGSDRPRTTYLSSGPVPLFFRTKPVEIPSLDQGDSVTKAPDGDPSKELVEPQVTGENPDVDPGQPVTESTPEKISESDTPNELPEPVETESGNIAEMEVVEDTPENNTEEILQEDALSDNDETVVNVSPSDVQRNNSNENRRESDAYLEKLRWNLDKYRSGNLSSLTDLPILPAHLFIESDKGSESGLSIIKRPDIDLLGDSYFGKTTPVNSPDPQWEDIGEAILQEIHDLSSGVSDRRIETEMKTSIRKPYPFGFRAPGPVWMPANSSATYSNGNE